MPSEVEELLLSHGVKPTPQRVVITEFLLRTDSHPTADQVFEAVVNALPVPLSRATVYNTLNALVQAGVVKEVSTEPGRTRYDANLDRHHHFVDVNTGEIIDIPWQEVPQLPKNLNPRFKVHGYQIIFFGELDKGH
ncbi:MAG TPA: transcriptional repressor [Candidatus Obscuribacterales bacterium]